MEKSDEILRLNSLLDKIDSSMNYENNFEMLYELIIDEFDLNPFDNPNMLKEARVYLSEKKKHPNNKELNLHYYKSFLSDVRSFVFHKIQRIKAGS